MIDYDKIKAASQICLNTKYFFNIDLGVDDGTIALYDSESNISFVCNPTDLDDLIAKLKELTQPKPKYRIGDTLWFEHNKVVIEGRIDETSDEYSKDYHLHSVISPSIGFCVHESSLYPTKSELIEAQISYWEKLAHEESCRKLGVPTQDECAALGDDCECRQTEKEEPCDDVVTKCQHDWNMMAIKNNEKGWKCRICEEWRTSKVCWHESDGQMLLSCPPQWKCLKCGELYI